MNDVDFPVSSKLQNKISSSFKTTFSHKMRAWHRFQLAEICMSNIEQSLKIYPSFPKILFFKRYVHDINCIFDENLADIQAYLNFLNNLHDAIYFTMVLGTSNKLHLLDILLYIDTSYSQFFTNLPAQTA